MRRKLSGTRPAYTMNISVLNFLGLEKRRRMCVGRGEESVDGRRILYGLISDLGT